MPQVILFDEAFSSLDEVLKLKITGSITEILKQQNITGIFVTHDQTEALGVADRIAIMQKGAILQVASPRNIYFQPSHKFVASFIGVGQFIQAKILSKSRIATDFGVLESGSAITIYPQPNEQNAELKTLPSDKLSKKSQRSVIPVKTGIQDLTGWIPASAGMTKEASTTSSNLENAQSGDKAWLFIRPENLCFDAHSLTRAKILEKIFQGPTYLYTLELASGLVFQMSAAYHFDYQVGERLGVRLDVRREICLFAGVGN